MRRARRILYTSFAAILSLFTLYASSADAEDRCAGSGPVAIRTAPAGSQKASLYPMTCVQVQDSGQPWVQVTLTGWVHRDDLRQATIGAKNPNAIGAGATQANDLLVLEGYDLQLGNRDLQGTPGRVLLTLKVKNISSSPVTSWSGMIAVENKQGEVVLRYRVADAEAKLAPNAGGTVSYYWDKGDEPFDILSAYTKDDIKVTLHKVTVQ
jgi:hypothetical protein